MLIITGDCQYTLLGLSRLLASLLPVVMSPRQWLEAESPPAAALLMVPGRGALADLLPVAEKARQAAVPRLALLGDAGQGVFMNSFGLVPDCVIARTLPTDLLRSRVREWLRFGGTRLRSDWLRHRQPETLTPRERQVLSVALAGIPSGVASAELGISIKTFYTLRQNALARLGLRSVRAMLANPATGIPSPSGCYCSLLGLAGENAVCR